MIQSLSTVSVILTAFRRTDFLAVAIRSALDQTHAPLEVIVTDDSAQADIANIVDRCGAPGVVRYRSNPSPLGAAGNVAAALAECRGELVAVLNDDDFWAPTLLASLAAPLNRYPQASLAFCDHWLVDGAGAVDVAATSRFSARYRRSTLAEGLVVDAATVAVVRRSVPAAICALFRREVIAPGEIPAAVRGAYDFWLAAAAAAASRPFYYVAVRLASYRVHGSMESRRPSPSGSEGHRAALAEIRRRGWFPELRGYLRRSWADVNCDCALDRLAHGDGAAARRLFVTSLGNRPSLRALWGLCLALAPGTGRRLLTRRRAVHAGP